MTIKSFLNHSEDIRLTTGIVITEQFQIFVSLKSIALTAIDVAQENKCSCNPILVRWIFINNFFRIEPCFRQIVDVKIVL